MVIREVYRTNIGSPFNSSKGGLDGHPGSIPNKYRLPLWLLQRGGLMVIREGYRTSIGPPFDSFMERLDGHPGRLPNKYRLPP
jgi:hypothetical protein